MLTNSQHGFRPNHSTVTAILEIANKWFHNIHIGQLNRVVFLDLKKAFDTVDHKILLHKLHLYGIKGIALNWFRSYLSNRKQYCWVNDHLSHPQEMVCGIPQGSILGPLLFLIYVNDLPNCLKHTRCNMFADDTQINTSSNNIDSIANILSEDLINVSDWMKANKLRLNASKTEYMVIGSHKRLHQTQSDIIKPWYNLISIIVPKFGESLVPHFVINFSDYKIELSVLLQRVGTKSVM